MKPKPSGVSPAGYDESRVLWAAIAEVASRVLPFDRMIIATLGDS